MTSKHRSAAHRGKDLAPTADATRKGYSSRELALQALAAAFTKNALQPVLLDVSALASYTDFILVLSARSIRQVEAIREAIELGLKERGQNAHGVEGERGGQWMLLDYSDVVMHVFYHPQREYYDLEGLWADAPRVELDVPPELQVARVPYASPRDLD
jgi:ribosome-associated protein